MTRFYSPYQFIPVNTPRDTATLTEYDKIKAGKVSFVRHDRWDEDSYSGRVVCRLSTISPLVIGTRQEQPDEEEPATVIPYAEGQRLPANSLRGMIASVVESISNSAMRVLSKKEAHEYSVRMQPRNAFRKIGLLMQQKDGQYRLYPFNKFESVPRNKLKGKKSYQHQDNNEQDNWHGQSGIFYLRGYHRDMPNKQKEYFIPWNGKLQNLGKPLLVDEQVVSSLDQELSKAMERNPDFPYLPVGYKRPERNAKKGFVRSGDLVFFDADGSKVTAISYSAIWRRPVGNLYDSLERIDKNLLPWNSGREALTPAEALFGVIEKAGDGGAMDDTARNLASRLRFHDARAESTVTLPEDAILLKILASPKPPSPSMYFRNAQGGYVSKQKLDLSKHKPNGRKRYLPHPDWKTTLNGNKQWETAHENDNRKQKLYCRPIPDNTTYWFHIDFENLSENELDLLRRAITPAPEQAFQHQLGLGKPLGLGQVKVEEIGVFLIDRKSRYGMQGVFAPRYAKAYRKPNEPLTSEYAQEEKAENQENLLTLKEPEQNPLLDSNALQVLRQIGLPKQYMDPDIPVCYPFHSTQARCEETQGFVWYVNNEKSQRSQFLQEVKEHHKLPILDSDTEHWQQTTQGIVDENQQALKLGGLVPKNKRDYSEKEVEEAIERTWPGTRVQEVNLGKGRVVLVTASALKQALENNESVSFPVTEDSTLTLRLE